MNDIPQIPASIPYLVGTALLAGVTGALLSFLAARLIGVSGTIAATVGGVSLALIVGWLIHRHGRPHEEL